MMPYYLGSFKTHTHRTPLGLYERMHIEHRMIGWGKREGRREQGMEK